MPSPDFPTTRCGQPRRGQPRCGQPLLILAIVALTYLMGVVNVLSAVTPGLKHRVALLRPLLPLEVRWGSHLTAALSGFALLLLAHGLGRRKRAAWSLALGALVLSAVSHLAKGLDGEEALLALLLIGALLSQRRQFTARSDAPTVRRGLIVTLAALLFTLLYGAIGFYLLDRHFKRTFGLGAALAQTFWMFANFSDPGLIPRTRFGAWFAGSIYAVAASTLGYALLALLRPVLPRRVAGDAERRRARQIVEAYGRSSLARFLLFDDKRYLFTPGGSVIGYAVTGRVCVALGDPIGPPADAAAAIGSFRALCARHDWLPVFYQTLPELLPEYQAAGLNALCIGQEAVVDLAAFTLNGRNNKSLRGNVNRLRKSGYDVALFRPPHAAALIEELRQISDQWLRCQSGREKSFSLGVFDAEYLNDGLLMAVRTPEGDLSAFANIVPEYTVPQVTIDLMRRRHPVANGTMDLLFVGLIEWARDAGFCTFNLGLSPLAGVGECPTDSPSAARAARFFYAQPNNFYNFRGLHAYKEKFQPTWEPRYLIYPQSVHLPTAALAVIRLDNGDTAWPGAALWRFLYEAYFA